jgi:flagellar motor switch protein FliM
VVVGVFNVSDSDAIAVADIFFGGPGTGADRRLAPIELTAITSSLPQVLQPIIEAVAPTAAHGVALVPASDSGIEAPDLVRLDLTFTIDEVEVAASIHVPDPDKSASVDGPSNDLLEIVSGMPLRFDVDLADVSMAASDVQELAEGDVILFDSPPDGDVTVRSGNREFLRGTINGSDGRRTLCVTQVLTTQ